MSDNTHEAPERIFVTGNATTGSWNAAPRPSVAPVEIEYIRADVIEAMVARAIAAERERCAEVDEILAELKGETDSNILTDDMMLAAEFQARNVAAVIAVLEGETWDE